MAVWVVVGMMDSIVIGIAAGVIRTIVTREIDSTYNNDCEPCTFC